MQHLNQNGLFPAPRQTDEIFLAKVDYAQSHLDQDAALPDLLKPFDIAPLWIDILNSNEHLHWWEGAALFLTETDAGFRIPEIQLSRRAGLFYSKEELIAHEMIHAVRSDFKEEKFEEVLAYASSSKPWRRWIGPFFRNPRESAIFVWATAVTVGLQWLELFTDWSSGWFLFPWIPALLILIGLARLLYTQIQFKRCLRNLRSAITTPDQALAVSLRLSDKEIESFSQMKAEQIKPYVEEEKHRSLRWKMLAVCYFSN